MATRVHALNIADVVSLLPALRRGLAGLPARETAGHQTGASAHGGAMMAIDRGPEDAPGYRPYCGAARGRRPPAAPLARRVRHLLVSIGAARRIVALELIEAFAGPGQGEDIRALR